MKKPPSEILVGILLILASAVLLVISPGKVAAALRDNTAIIVKTLILTLFAVGVSVVIHFLLPPDFAERRLSGTGLRRQFRYVFFATVLGILTPGPVYAIYPIVLAMKSKGVPNPILVSYITGQTIIGPARIPFEVGLLGIRFFAYRLALSVVVGTAAGLLYIALSRWLPDTK